MINKGSVVQQINRILHNAIEAGVSDIHLESFENAFRVRYRCDGVLRQIGELAVSQKDSLISRIKILAELDIAEKRRPQDGRIRIQQNGHYIDIRVSTLPTVFGEKVVMRILDKSSLRLDINVLGIEPSDLVQFKKTISAPYGMILVSGPTGSGKTTSLYAALNYLNTGEVNITTIEDPIEYHLNGVNQTQVRSEIGLTFANALRSILRQDPNIIMVGEIRDKETAKIAIRSALTGHLVLSTIHTNDAPSTIIRLIDMGIEPYLVSSSLRLIIAQRLVRCICSKCRMEMTYDSSMLSDIGLQFGERLYKGKGCSHCNVTGYKGRTALFEAISVDDEVSGLIGSNVGITEIRKYLSEKGHKTLRDHGAQKVLAGITTLEEVIRETTM